MIYVILTVYGFRGSGFKVKKTFSPTSEANERKVTRNFEPE
jgi:hypothetical protein